MAACDLNLRVARRIAEVRRSLGLTQRAVAENLDLAVRNYQRIEAGSHNLTLKMVEVIAAALEVDADELLKVPSTEAMRVNRGRPPKAP